MKIKIFSIKELTEIIKERQNNEFDCNIIVSGARGNGKSTFLFKLLSRLSNFKPWEHQVYSREDVINLLENQKKGIIFDDEAINSGYKRKFQNKEQQNLIVMMNMYRDNYNIYASAVPSFFSLDKDIRSLMKIHIQIIERGKGIVHFAKTDRAYSNDPWDIKYNQKLEEGWQKKEKKNPRYKPPYWKLTTFKGYIQFGDLGKEQKELYKKIKLIKRKKIYDEKIKKEEKENPIEKIYKNIKEGLYKSSDDIKLIAPVLGLNYRQLREKLNNYIQDKEPTMTYSKLLSKNSSEEKGKESKKKSHASSEITKEKGKSLIPDIPL